MPQPVPPRYCQTRDLPRGHSLPGERAGAGWHGQPLPDDVQPPGNWLDSEAWLFAVDLWNGGFTWEASEVLEGVWRKARESNPVQGKFLQALIKLAGSEIHRKRGRLEASESLKREALLALKRVEMEAGPVFMGLVLEAFIRSLESGIPAGEGAPGPGKIILEDPSPA